MFIFGPWNVEGTTRWRTMDWRLPEQHGCIPPRVFVLGQPLCFGFMSTHPFGPPEREKEETLHGVSHLLCRQDEEDPKKCMTGRGNLVLGV